MNGYVNDTFALAITKRILSDRSAVFVTYISYNESGETLQSEQKGTLLISQIL